MVSARQREMLEAVLVAAQEGDLALIDMQHDVLLCIIDHDIHGDQAFIPVANMLHGPTEKEEKNHVLTAH